MEKQVMKSAEMIFEITGQSKTLQFTDKQSVPEPLHSLYSQA